MILLDHRVIDQVSTRRLRVVKYRGSAHGTNEYPFLIGARRLLGAADHVAAARPRGVDRARLDRHRRARRDARRQGRLPRQQHARLGRAGHRQEQRRRAASSTPPARAASASLLFAYEESASQLVRNMRSIGIDLEPLGQEGPARTSTPRGRRCRGSSSTSSLMYDAGARRSGPTSSSSTRSATCRSTATTPALKPTLMRLIDFLKQSHVTARLHQPHRRQRRGARRDRRSASRR